MSQYLSVDAAYIEAMNETVGINYRQLVIDLRSVILVEKMRGADDYEGDIPPNWKRVDKDKTAKP